MINLRFKIDFTARPIIMLLYVFMLGIGLVSIFFVSRLLFEKFFTAEKQIQDILDKRDKYSVESINKNKIEGIGFYLEHKQGLITEFDKRNPFLKK